MALSDYQALVPKLVRDTAGRLASGDIDQAIALAVTRYSKDRPRRVVVDLNIAGGGNLIDLPAGFEADFSAIVSLEYPIGQVPPAFIGADQYDLYPMPAAVKLMLLSSVPAGAVLRLTHTGRHVVSASEDTIPADDLEPVASWAAAICCEQIASFYANNSEPTIQADRTDQQSPAREYARRAKELRQRYLAELGVRDKKNVAGGEVVNWNLGNSLGRDRLTHPNRYR
ncbi:phage adaptor protein [Methylocaldum gracile]|jgi:hypothetical protein|uniref:phage adaptor protein n=1 Tax=Methylocaldum sp. 0917 TaxID=2485163 RepID=UPI001061E8E9